MASRLFQRAFGRAVSNTLRSPTPSRLFVSPHHTSSISPRLIQRDTFNSLTLFQTLPFTTITTPTYCQRSRIFQSLPKKIWNAPVYSSQSRMFSSSSRTQSPRHTPNPKRQPQYFQSFDLIHRDILFWGIIGLNAVVFVMWQLAGQQMMRGDSSAYMWMKRNFTVSWQNISSLRIWTPITACFSHETVGHILFNLFTFYFTAKPVLGMLGSRSFILLYLGGGIFANMASTAWNKLTKNRDVGSHGASAAIYAVVSFLACVAPNLTFQLYGIIPVPAWLLVVGIFSYDTYSAVYDKRRTTDTAGHVAGLLAGVGYFLGRSFRIF